jgi:hypothetical protein
MRYAFQIGNQKAAVHIMVQATSREEAVRIVREELEQHRNPAKVYPEFGVDMPSARFELFNVMFRPGEITAADISVEIDPDGTPRTL